MTRVRARGVVVPVLGIALAFAAASACAFLGAGVLRGNFQMDTLQWVGVTDPDMLRRVYHSKQTPPAGLNRVSYSNAGVDRLIEAAASAVGDERRRPFYTRAQQLIADDVPYISLRCKTNVAVFQPDIAGVTLSPIADFAFLKNLSRTAPAPSAARPAPQAAVRPASAKATAVRRAWKAEASAKAEVAARPIDELRVALSHVEGRERPFDEAQGRPEALEGRAGAGRLRQGYGELRRSLAKARPRER